MVLSGEVGGQRPEDAAGEEGAGMTTRAGRAATEWSHVGVFVGSGAEE